MNYIYFLTHYHFSNQGEITQFSSYDAQLLKFSSELSETNQILHENDYDLCYFTTVTISPKYHISGLFKHLGYVL